MKKLNGNFKKLLGLGAVALAASAVSKSTKAETLSTEDQSLFGLVSEQTETPQEETTPTNYTDLAEVKAVKSQILNISNQIATEKTAIDAKSVIVETDKNITAGYKSDTLQLKTDTDLIKTQTLQAKADALNYLSGLTSIDGDLGAYNAATNTPALTATPSGTINDGQYFTVTVPGAVGFGGTNFVSGHILGVGYRLIKQGINWVLSTTTNKEELETLIEGKLNFKISDLNEGFFGIDDENGRLALLLTSLGKLIINEIQVGESTFKTINSDQYLFGVSDQETSPLFFFDNQFRLNLKSIVSNDIILGTEGKNRINEGLKFIGGGFSDYKLVLSFGQSNAIGGGGGQLAITEKYDSLTTQDGARLGNQQFVPFYNDGVTTPLLGIFNQFIELIKKRRLLDYQDKGFKFIGTAPGQGSTTADNLSKGSTPYAKLISNVQNSVENASLERKSINVPFLVFTQGENEIDDLTSYESYLTTLNVLIADLNTDIKTITGQKQNIPLISYQIAKHTSSPDYDKIAKAHLNLGLTNDLFICACPSYHFEYIIEGSTGGTGGFIVHLTPEFRLIYGAYVAIAAFKTVIEGVKFKPLHIQNYLIEGNDIYLFYHLPHSGLKFDTQTIQNNGNYGFTINENSISSVKIISKDTIKITCNSNPAGQTLHYNRNQNYSYIMDYPNLIGKFKGGNIRDIQGEEMKFNGYDLHNWAVSQSITL
jgi:hypothetical protein